MQQKRVFFPVYIDTRSGLETWELGKEQSKVYEAWVVSKMDMEDVIGEEGFDLDEAQLGAKKRNYRIPLRVWDTIWG